MLPSEPNFTRYFHREVLSKKVSLVFVCLSDSRDAQTSITVQRVAENRGMWNYRNNVTLLWHGASRIRLVTLLLYLLMAPEADF